MAWAWVLWHKNIGKWEVDGHLLRTHVEFMTRQWFFSSAPYLGHLKSFSALTSLGIVNDKAPMKPAEQGVCALGMAGRGWLLHHKELKFCGVQCGHAWPQPTSCMVRECTVLSPDCSLALAGDEGCRMKGWRKDGLNFLVPSNSDVEIPVPSVMVCGDGVFERWLGLEEVMRVNHSQWDSCRYEIRHELVSSSCSLPCEVKQEDAIYKPGSGSSPETGFAGILTLDFPTSRTMRNNCYLSLPVMAAQVESVSGKNHFWSQGLYSLNSTVCYSSKLTNANWIYLFSHFSLCSVIERSKGT